MNRSLPVVRHDFQLDQRTKHLALPARPHVTHLLGPQLVLRYVHAKHGPKATQQLPPGPLLHHAVRRQVLLDAPHGQALDLQGEQQWHQVTSNPLPSRETRWQELSRQLPFDVDATGFHVDHAIARTIGHLLLSAWKSEHPGIFTGTPATLSERKPTPAATALWQPPHPGYLQPLELLTGEEALAGSLEERHRLGDQLVPLLLQPGDHARLQENLGGDKGST